MVLIVLGQKDMVLSPCPEPAQADLTKLRGHHIHVQD